MKYTTGRFIDPLSDFGFKHLFGNEPNKDILIDLLNQLFLGQKIIEDLVYNQTEYSGEGDNAKTVFFDLQCTGNNGEQFIIEMQRAEQRNFRERAVFYTSRLISSQLLKGQDHWNMDLNEVYLVAILEFDLKPHLPGKVLQHVALLDQDTHAIFYDKLGFKFLKLRNFEKTEQELETDLDRWCFLLKNMSRLDKIPDILSKKVFQKIFKIAEITNLTKEEKIMYDSSLKAKWDYENTIAFAEEEAAKKAREEGRVEGRADGIQQSTIDIARRMKRSGMDLRQIIEFTGLTIVELESL